MNYTYPVGSIYITCNSTKLTPPGCTAITFDNLHDGLSIAGIISAEYDYDNKDPTKVNPGSYNGIQMNWQLLPHNCSLWSTYIENEIGSTLSA